ncbi:hypothetical protein SDRG_06292 [Saprolegnia diclina VS20]|uniref:Uncharacterized protein n=1 Tax=Saprolegnia diclina (strain VS20) TaxID=1156394 RepID=T0QE53_SAPDV|nr:hypothetical protein SDRG_06292 [Saprolegnia diclina VS20]EQC36179.1 hypothetical protein SDRG_06292 [Saprolegnia diclina VS20]|eukprot:XP_008610285.1 hypothetical protein SDRG_06292 [Saprolegnia diclina VS20]
MLSTLARTTRLRPLLGRCLSTKPPKTLMIAYATAQRFQLEDDASIVDVPTMLERKLGYVPVVHCIRDATGDTFQRPLAKDTVEIFFDCGNSDGDAPKETELNEIAVTISKLQQAVKDANARTDVANARTDVANARADIFKTLAANYKALVVVGEAQNKTLKADNFKFKRERELDELGEFVAKFRTFRKQKRQGGKPSKLKMRRTSNSDIDPSLAAVNDQRNARAHPVYSYASLRAIIDAITLDEFPDFPETKASCDAALEEFEREATTDQKHPWRFND